MESVLSIVGLAMLAFAATNLDNLLVLVALLSRAGQPFSAVVGGALVSAVAVLALCIAAALAADFVPQRWVGYLGVVPVALGLRELYRLRQTGMHAGAEPEVDAPPLPVLGVAGVMLANSADSFGALVPLFAETRDALLPAIAVAVLGASLIGCGAARWITTHARYGPPIQRFGPRLVPFVLIAVGLYVLSNTPTDTLPGVP